MLKSIDTLDELKEAVTTNNIAVVDLYATWCKPCQEMLPVIEELSNTNDIPSFLNSMTRALSMHLAW